MSDEHTVVVVATSLEFSLMADDCETLEFNKAMSGGFKMILEVVASLTFENSPMSGIGSGDCAIFEVNKVTSGGFKLILEVASSLEIGNIGEAGGDTSIIQTSRKDRSKACTV